MNKKYLVISQFAQEKEMAPWWENKTLQHYSAEVFTDFASAKGFMRKQIAQMLAESWEMLKGRLFGEDEPEDDDTCDEEEDAIIAAISQIIGMNRFSQWDTRVGKIKALTNSIILDDGYVPQQIDEIKITDDGDHYEAFVCNENYVLAQTDGIRMEYNVHKMDNEALLYYFNVYAEMDENRECIVSVKLINTEENIDNSTVKIQDRVDCQQMELGAFVQDDGEDAQAEAIVWDVIDEKEDCLLVVSHKCLDYRTFNDGKTSATWGKSEIRKWLNGAFFHSAFSREEKEKILLTSLSNGKGAKKTEDYVFLLSEAEYSLLGRDNRSALLTKYARSRYQEQLDRKYTEPYGFWWLRSRGVDVQYGYDTTHVCANGSLNGYARSDSSHPNGIRPAMWIKK